MAYPFKRIAMANDHAAVEMKREIAAYVEAKGVEVVDFGTNSTESCDYPRYGFLAAKAVAEGQADGAILICGTGVGMGLTANKVRGIRAVTCSEPYSARMSRHHNDSNVLTFGARVIGIETAKDIVDAWLGTPFDGGRHQRRIDLITEIEQTQEIG